MRRRDIFQKPKHVFLKPSKWFLFLKLIRAEAQKHLESFNMSEFCWNIFIFIFILLWWLARVLESKPAHSQTHHVPSHSIGADLKHTANQESVCRYIWIWNTETQSSISCTSMEQHNSLRFTHTHTHTLSFTSPSVFPSVVAALILYWMVISVRGLQRAKTWLNRTFWLRAANLQLETRSQILTNRTTSFKCSDEATAAERLELHGSRVQLRQIMTI